MKIQFREFAPEMWPELEKLFGPSGACGGCWCMWWRLKKGEKWADVKGAENKRRFRRLAKSGAVHGMLAFAGEEAVGWCSFEAKGDLERLARSPSLKSADEDDVWALPCFFVKAGWREQGIAERLLKESIKAIRRRGGKIAEGYPTLPYNGAGRAIASVNFAFTGFPGMFKRAGFKTAEARPTGKQRVRRKL